MGFEPTIPVSERAKTFHALDGTGIVIGSVQIKFFILREFPPERCLEEPININEHHFIFATYCNVL
jgi:hypothetical protein